MDILEAKQEVVKAGLQLVESGLIARTWGNVSCRVDDEYFVITPSGRTYESLTPDDIVIVRIADCAYESDIKPSSEKGIHAQAYKLRPDCNFVIHTHQLNASAVSFLGYDIPVEDEDAKAVIGSIVPIAKYGLSGTGKLKKNVAAAIARTDSKAVIMTHHGAVCLGKDYDEAFAVAGRLEQVCADFLTDRLQAVSGTVTKQVEAISSFLADANESRSQVEQFAAYTSERDGSTVIMRPRSGEEAVRIDIKTGDEMNGGTREYPASAELHRAVYAAREDVNAIVHCDDPEVVDYSKFSGKVKPLIDDFAQIVGVTMKTAEYDPHNTMKTARKVVKKLKGRNAVMLRNNGALCAAANQYDAEAVEMVVKKEIRANAAADIIGGAKYIGRISACLERFVYTKKYSKQTKTNQ